MHFFVSNSVPGKTLLPDNIHVIGRRRGGVAIEFFICMTKSSRKKCTGHTPPRESFLGRLNLSRDARKSAFSKGFQPGATKSACTVTEAG